MAISTIGTTAAFGLRQLRNEYYGRYDNNCGQEVGQQHCQQSKPLVDANRNAVALLVFFPVRGLDLDNLVVFVDEGAFLVGLAAAAGRDDMHLDTHYAVGNRYHFPIVGGYLTHFLNLNFNDLG